MVHYIPNARRGREKYKGGESRIDQLPKNGISEYRSRLQMKAEPNKMVCLGSSSSLMCRVLSNQGNKTKKKLT